MPRAAVWTTFAALLAPALLAPLIRTDNSVEALLAQDDPASQDYRAFQRAFGTDEVMVAQVSGGDPIGLLRFAVELEAALSKADGVSHTLGPNSVYGESVALLTDEVLGGPDALAEQSPSFAGPLGRALKLFDPKAPSARVLAFGRASSVEAREHTRLALETLRTRAREEGRTLSYAGPPFLNLALDRAGRDLERWALPLLALVTMLVSLLFTRSLPATLALFLAVGLTIFAADGVLVALGQPTNILIATAKPLLLVLLLSSGIYVVEGFFDARQRGLSPDDAARAAVAEKAVPCLLSLLTSIIGFGSLLISPIAPVRWFGLVSSFGLAAGAPAVLILMPRWLALAARRTPKEPSSRSPLAEVSARSAAWAIRHKKTSIVVGLLFTAAGPFALQTLAPEPHAIHYFPPDHVVRKDYEALEAGGFGLATVELVLSSTTSFLGDPGQLARLDALAADAAKETGVRAVVGLPLLLRESAFRLGRGEVLPDLFTVGLAAEARPELFRELIQDQGRQARLSLLIGTLDADQIDALAERIRTRFAARFGAHATLHVTGSYALLLAAQRGLLQTLHGSLLGSGLLMLLVLFIALRSLRLGLIALVPNVVPCSLLFLFMAALHMPLDLGTSMSAAIALGIAVDNTLHYVDEWRKHGIVEAARAVGRPVLVTAFVVSAGFVALTGSEFGPTRNFGLLMALALSASLLADLFQLPALLSLLPVEKKPTQAS